MKSSRSLNPLAPYRGVAKRFVLLYKHVLGLIVGGLLAYVNQLPAYKRKWLRSPVSRFSAFILRPFVKKSIRNEAFEIQLRRRLELLGPTYVKLGQVMAIREDILPPNITRELKSLLDKLPAVDYQIIEQIIEESLGAPPDYLFKEIDKEPLGSASIGQTHRAVTKDDEEVVIKVIKPGIRDSILSDIRLLRILAHLLELLIPRYQPRIIIDEFCRYTEKEVDLTFEADHAEIFTANFKDEHDVVFPQIYRELSSEDILTMQFFDGWTPGDERMQLLAEEDQQKIMDLGTGAIIKMLYEDGFFHADLHAGNLFILPGPKIGFIDLGMVGRFDEKIKMHMLYYFYALVNDNIENASRHLLAMAKVGPGGDAEGFRRSVSDLFRRYQFQSAQGNFSLAQLILESLSIGGKHRVFFPVEMTLMVKALVTFEGVGRILDPNLDIPNISRKHVQKIFSRRFDPKRLVDKLLRGMPEFIDMMVYFPKLIADGSRSLQEFLDASPSENPLAGLRSSLVAGACIVGGTIAFVMNSHPLLWIGLFLSSVVFYFVVKS